MDGATTTGCRHVGAIGTCNRNRIDPYNRGTWPVPACGIEACRRPATTAHRLMNGLPCAEAFPALVQRTCGPARSGSSRPPVALPTYRYGISAIAIGGHHARHGP